MKRSLIVLCMILFLVTGCGNGKFIEISYDKFINMINKKDDFILFIGSSECSHCDKYKIVVNEIVENYNIDIYYIDVSLLNEEEIDKLLEISDFGGSTPTTVFIKDGKEFCGEDNNCSYYRIIGSQNYDKVLNKLKSKGYIK